MAIAALGRIVHGVNGSRRTGGARILQNRDSRVVEEVGEAVEDLGPKPAASSSSRFSLARMAHPSIGTPLVHRIASPIATSQLRISDPFATSPTIDPAITTRFTALLTSVWPPTRVTP